MERDHIQDLWNQEREGLTMSKAEIQQLLRPRVHRQSARFRTAGIWGAIFLPAATLVIGSLNVLGYRSNPTMLFVLGTMMLAAAGMLAYGVDVARTHERMQRQDTDLVTAVRHQLHFYRDRYNAWLWMVAGALVLLSLNVNFLVDNQGGHYPFNPSFTFVGFILTQFVLVYALFRLSQYAYVREMRAILSDLERQATEATERFDASFKPAWSRWTIVCAVVGTILLILGILAALQFTQ